MMTNTASKPSVRMAARFAYAAGTTGIFANLFLIASRLAQPEIWWDRWRPRS